MTAKKQILCLSRAYLSRLLPALGELHEEADYLHIVQSDSEARYIEALGQKVAINLQTVVRDALKADRGGSWKEPDDFRAVTGCDWSPIYLDRYLPEFTSKQRAAIASSIFDAIEKLFRENEITAFLSEPVALFVTHVIFYFCKKNNVLPLLWMNAYFPDYFYFTDSILASPKTKRWPLDADTQKQLREHIASYLEGVASDQKGPLYHFAFSGEASRALGYLSQRKGNAALVLRPGFVSILLQAARAVRSAWYRLMFARFGEFIVAGALKEHCYYFKCLMTPRSIYDELPRCASENNIVYTLQYEPEASLLYWGSAIVSQISLVETVLRAMPSEKLLFVKEHPNQFGALGLAPWRSLRKRYSNLRIIHGRESGRELIKRSGLIVTISSSMGMDALVLGKPVVVCGDVYYQKFPGAQKVSSYKQLAELMMKPDLVGPKPTIPALTNALMDLESCVYKGDPQPASQLYSTENLARLVRAIREEITTSV